MNLNLTNHVALVVGGARGIGLAMAKAFAQEGCRVNLIDRAEDVENVALALGAGAKGYRADAVNYPAMQAAVHAIVAAHGRIDHVVFAVGIGSGKFGFPFWNLEPSDWPRVLEVNILSAVNTLHAVTPAMIAAKNGTILLIASVAGQIGSQTDPPYSASKAALINFAQCAAKDLAPYNVRVNTLNPGMVKTALNEAVWAAWNRQQPEGSRQSYDEWASEKIRKVVPLGRWQTPEDMAAMALFLASDHAANICGQTLNVDGGFVMHW
jgi:NAD(P)-dependent dehydrogenase (short-subunit alcohol dehydrogenase family)